METLMKLERTGEVGKSLPDLGTSDFTITAWIKTESRGGTILAKAPERGNWAPGGKVFFLQDGTPTFDVGWVGNIETEVQVNDGNWHHLALAKADKLEFYVDGQLVSSHTLRMDPDVADHVLKIGFCSGDFPRQSGLEGDIDEVRIYRRRLFAVEVKRIYNNEVSDVGGWYTNEFFERGFAYRKSRLRNQRLGYDGYVVEA